MMAKYVPGTANSTAKNPNTNPYTATASHCGDLLSGIGEGVAVAVAVKGVVTERESVWLSNEAAMVVVSPAGKNEDAERHKVS
jgi:hypothetical protein